MSCLVGPVRCPSLNLAKPRPEGPCNLSRDSTYENRACLAAGTPSSPSGTIQHPIRFTLNHILNYWVWPATQTAGVGSCTATGGVPFPWNRKFRNLLLPQAAPCPDPLARSIDKRLQSRLPLTSASAPNARAAVWACQVYEATGDAHDVPCYRSELLLYLAVSWRCPEVNFFAN